MRTTNTTPDKPIQSVHDDCRPWLDRKVQADIAAWKMKDIVVLHKGETIWNWRSKQADGAAAVYSCTKSILSALIGLAIESGHIGGPDQPISDYFEAAERSADARKRAITIGHLLTMTSGIDWPDFDKPYWLMNRTTDWVGFVLDQPMAHRPGEVFAYNSGGSHLLSAILMKATGEPVFDYAKRRLFDKLGFRKPRWNSSSGIHEGGTGLHLTAGDMAKFGQLYLQRGHWAGETIIPPSWVDASTKAHHKGLLHYEPPIFGEYGYHWWVSPREHNGAADCYFALGFGGQYIFIVPELELVAAIRKQPEGRGNSILSKRLLFEHIVPLVRLRR